MKEIKTHPAKIAEILIENLKNPDTVFVFSTDTVMNSWVEYLVTHSADSGFDALPLDRFTAWDTFKGKYLRAQQKGSGTVPAILRKLFVQDLISKNAAAPQAERFQVIINPQDDFAGTATSFADWICKNLPSLHFWKKRMTENAATYGQPDAEDLDYEKLYQAYNAFLKANNLFEPAWLDNLDLSDRSTTFIILYPELLEDFQDFTDIFKTCDNITICTMPENIPIPAAYLYPDSRSELRQTMLRIIDLVQNGKADWSEIALSVPSMDIYRPYLEREFTLYGIPFVIKSGVSLTANSAGKIFREIANCHTTDFTFDSVRALLLDECVPWKEEHKQAREGLVRVGNEMRCICSPEEKDIWLSSFAKKLISLKAQNSPEAVIKEYENLKDFYLKVKFHVEEFYRNKNFAGIENAWLSFKRYFLESDEKFSPEANAILGRCITELKEIIAIEKQYQACQLQVNNPFDFFISEIDGKKYSPQQKDKTGVSIFAYKLSGPAYFKYQFVIDASQKNLEVPYKRLTFLNATKRARLHLIDDDKQVRASEAFIKLYARDSSFVTFSAAENTFNGFAIPHSKLEVLSDSPDLSPSDYIKNEHNYDLAPEDFKAPDRLLPSQKEAFYLWCKTQSESGDSEYKINEIIKQNIKRILIEKRNNAEDINGQIVKDEKLKITARSDMEKFFPCPRQWLLKSVLKLKDDSLDTNLMQNTDMGNLNHKILEDFFTEFTDKNLPYYDEVSDSFMLYPDFSKCNEIPAETYNLDLSEIVKKAIFSQKSFKDSPLVTNSLEAQKDKIISQMTDFLKFLLKPFGPTNTPREDWKKMAGIGNCRVIGCEKTLVLQDRDFDYYGKIDNLLETPGPQDGGEYSWIVLDYKNSSMPTTKDINKTDNDILSDFQMPVYLTLIGKEKKHPVAASYFYSIVNKENRKVIDCFSRAKEKDENGKAKRNGEYLPDALFEHFEPSVNVMQEYAKLFNSIANPESGSLDFQPHTSKSEKDKLNVKAYEACTKCSLKGICRTTYTTGEKTIKTGAAEWAKNIHF